MSRRKTDNELRGEQITALAALAGGNIIAWRTFDVLERDGFVRLAKGKTMREAEITEKGKQVLQLFDASFRHRRYLAVRARIIALRQFDPARLP